MWLLLLAVVHARTRFYERNYWVDGCNEQYVKRGLPFCDRNVANSPRGSLGNDLVRYTRYSPGDLVEVTVCRKDQLPPVGLSVEVGDY